MKKFLSVLAAFTLGALAFSLDATVVKTSGKVEVQKGTNWVAVKEGDVLGKGAVISTGFKSEATLKIRDSVVTVAALTRMTIEQIVEKPGKDETRIFLDTGSLKSNVKHTADRRTGFTVRSPVATASVRGTEFTISTGFGTTNLETSQGAVAFFPTDGEAAPSLSTEEEDAAAPVMPGTANTAAAVAPQSPRGAMAVTKGQGASLASKGGKTTSVVETAEKQVSIVPPTTAAVKEASTVASPAASTQVTSVESGPAQSSGTLSITVSWE